MYSLGSEITPYKFTDLDQIEAYGIPDSCRFTAKRSDHKAPDLIYYLSQPQTASYPIAILCGGSSLKENIVSIIHFHRYFLKEFLDRGTAVLTVEQWGVDGQLVDVTAFMEHYTRSERLQDHQSVIEHLQLNPPPGWNGKLIFLGVSEGGLIVTTLSEKYSDQTIATINWCGAGDWTWREELWAFIEELRKEFPLFDIFKSRQEYDALLDQTLIRPDVDQELLGMTYKYHADALTYPPPNYQKIKTPFLVVAGAKDSIIQSTDAFVEKAKSAQAKITYLRVPDMDHYIRKRPDIIEQSLQWLDSHLKSLR